MESRVDIIQSVPEYLKYIEGIPNLAATTNSLGCFTFYRGQANADWGLSPSLYRQGLFNVESLLLTELRHICPTEFTDNKFDTLVKLQHFGLPTRLLDTTTNPLVALYFACDSNRETNSDAAVFIFPNLPVLWSTNVLVQFVMDYVFEYAPESICLEDMLQQLNVKHGGQKYGIRPEELWSWSYALRNPAFAVMPTKGNRRIEAQSGAFFIYGMALSNTTVSTNQGTYGKVYYTFNKVDIDAPNKLWHLAQKVIIPSSAKPGIMQQLDLLGINEGKLFPDLSHQIKYVTDLVKKTALKLQ